MNLLLDAEGLRSLLKFHVIPQQISIRDLKTRDKLETLSPPMDIHVSNYMKRVRSRRRRYLRKPVSALQCAMVVGQPEVVPCNGAILIVDKVSKQVILVHTQVVLVIQHTFLLQLIWFSGDMRDQTN